MPWTIYWDNGNDCGTWDHLLFEDENKAQEYANAVTDNYIAEGVWGEDCSAEPYWIEPQPTQETTNTVVEQSIDYFDRYIAGDR